MNLLVRGWRALLTEATGGGYVGIEKFLVFAVGAVAAGWLAWGPLHRGAIVGESLALVGGLVFLGCVKSMLKRIRWRSPGFLSRGSHELPTSHLRQATSLVALLSVCLLALSFFAGVLGFLLAVPPLVIWSLTGQRWATLWIGLPLAPVSVCVVAWLLGGPGSDRTHPHRPSTPTDHGRGDLREYEVRFGWHRALLFYQGLCWPIVVVSCVAWPDAPYLTVIGGAVFGGYAVYQLLGALMRNVAIRVGPAGVALGSRPVHGTVRFVPWSEIEAVVVSGVFNGARRGDCVGVLQRAHVQVGPVPAAAGEARGAEITTAPPGSVPAYAWYLDMERLTKAIQLNAPQVRFVDLRG